MCKQNIWVLIAFCLISCSTNNNLAPVVESNWSFARNRATQYVVKKGDTLYSIAFRYDSDYRQLAYINNLQSPYRLFVGQVINLKSKQNIVRRFKPQNTYLTRVTYKRNIQPNIHWVRPAPGKIVTYYAPARGSKGINIAGKKGDKIFASRGGYVAYSGHGLANYGNLIIIKHDNDYLTAYANNQRNLVTEGSYVKAGQAIADMGIVDRKYYGLHFEIRAKGHPVNPMSYLYMK
jgi:lipoprotein NlpD